MGWENRFRGSAEARFSTGHTVLSELISLGDQINARFANRGHTTGKADLGLATLFWLEMMVGADSCVLKICSVVFSV